MKDRKQIKDMARRVVDVFCSYISVARDIDDLRNEDDIDDLHSSIERTLLEGYRSPPGCEASSAPAALRLNKKLVTERGDKVEVLRDSSGSPAVCKFSENDSRFVVMINDCVYYLNNKNKVYMGQDFVSVINEPEFDEVPVKIVLYKDPMRRGNRNAAAAAYCPGMTGYESTVVDNKSCLKVILKVPR